VRTDGEATLAIDAPMTLDCSGQATFLANRKVTGPKYLGSYDKQIAFFTHVAGYRRDHAPADDRVNQPGNTHIFYKQKYQWAWDPHLGRHRQRRRRRSRSVLPGDGGVEGAVPPP